MRKLENEVELQFRARGGIVSLFNFGKVSNFAKVYTPKSDISELSKENGKVRKKRGRNFGEKRV